MKLQPIIKKKVELFKAEKGYEGVDDNKIFELFVNHHILYAEQPDKFFGNSDILDLVTVGGNNDMGMDGIAIMVNDSLISSKEDFDYLLENTKKIKIRFIFIQAKSGTDADSGEFSKFITGIKDFLQNERPIQPYNQKIEYILNIKNYIMKDEFISTWKEEPTLDIFFMTMGEHSSLPHIEAYKEIFSGEIGKGTTYKDVNFNIFGSKDLKSLCDSNENSFDVTFSYIQNMSLNEVGNVDDSCVILCQGNEFIKLLLNNNGYIRRTIFNDNVRDFQGNTHINNEIGKTIKVDPEKFVLLNNGVTIVCDKFIQKNRSIMVSNPQIVNGCQSSSMLYRAYKEGCDISRVPILVKIISTIDQSVTNQIVRSTNRQNIVYEEAFEITRHFHKNLEDFFGSQSVGNKQFFYERRARQFMNNESIRQDQKVSFKNIIQSSVSMFFHRPDIAHKHESQLIKIFQNKIFLDRQSFYPYYTSAISLLYLDRYFNEHPREKREYRAFNFYLLMIFNLSLSDCFVNINKEKEVDKHCKRLLEKLQNDYNNIFNKSINIFEKYRNKWISELGKSKDGIKDNYDFAKLILDNFFDYHYSLADESDIMIGKVKKIGIDRNGYRYGFIDHNPYDIFFHQSQNRDIDMDGLIEKLVSYKIVKNYRGDDIAVSLKIYNPSNQ